MVVSVGGNSSVVDVCNCVDVGDSVVSTGIVGSSVVLAESVVELVEVSNVVVGASDVVVESSDTLVVVVVFTGLPLNDNSY